MTRRLSTGLFYHYGWIVVAAGTLSVFACLGLGRFALGMLLPSMGASLGLSYGQMGFISSGNFVGYLVAVMAAGMLVGRFGSRSVVAVGLVMVGVSMMVIGLANGFGEILLLYVMTGLGSGAANVPVMGLISHWFARRHRGKAAGLVVSGSGLAIILSGYLVPVFNAADPAEGWRTGWLVLGAIAGVVAVLSWLMIRNRPDDLSLAPVGGADAGHTPGTDGHESRLGAGHWPTSAPSTFCSAQHM